MIGPNSAPTPAVPRRCSMNRAINMTTVTGTTYGSNACVATPNPSTALKIEMAGVIIMSPYSSEAPKRPNITSDHRVLRSRLRHGRSSASSARMPPSPRLSARSTNTMYLSEMMASNVHSTSDSTPSTFASLTGSGCGPLKHSRNA